MANEFIIRNGLTVISGQISGTLADNIIFSGNVNSGVIGTFHLASGVLSTATLGSGQVTSGVIASGTVNQFALSSGAVNSGHIGNAAVVSGSIASGSISKFQIASGQVVKGLAQGTSITITADANDVFTINAVVSGGMAPLIVSSGLSFSSGSYFDGTQSGAIIGINSGGITSQLIADNAIVSGKIASGSIGVFQLASGVISTATLGSGQVTSGVIGNAAVVSGSIASGSVGSLHLSSGAASANLLSGSVSNNQLANSSVTINGASTSLGGSYNNQTLTIGSGLTGGSYNGSGAVTIALASGASLSNLLSGSIGSGLLANNSVVSGSIASGQIGTNHIASGAILNANLSTGLIQASNMTFNSVLSGTLGSGIVGSVHLADGAVQSGDISSGQIGQFHVASGVLFSVTNPVDNRVLTSLASGTNQANAESNFTFDGSNLNVGSVGGLTTFSVTSGGYVKIQSSLFSGQVSTFNAYSIPQTDGVAAFYDYYVFNQTNGAYRAGNVVTTWNTASGIIVYSETGTDDLGGSTIDLQWSTVLQSGNVVLRPTLTAGTWNLKVGARVL
jgi:hypothetical protein